MKTTQSVKPLFIGLLSLALLFGTAHPGSAEDPVTIGILHNAEFAYASMMKNAFELARIDINKTGGINGRPLELIFGNDRGAKENWYRSGQMVG